MFEICQRNNLCDIMESIHCYITGDVDYGFKVQSRNHKWNIVQRVSVSDNLKSSNSDTYNVVLFQQFCVSLCCVK